MARQRRSERVVVYIEPIINTALLRFVNLSSGTEGDESVSNYVRSLIVNDLQSHGVLTDRMIVEATT